MGVDCSRTRSKVLANEEHDSRYTQVRDVFRERGEKRGCHLPVSQLECVIDGTHQRERRRISRGWRVAVSGFPSWRRGQHLRVQGLIV